VVDRRRGFTVAREFDATPERLWRAWTDPDEVARWWHPSKMHIPRESVEIDARVGGRYIRTIVNDDTGDQLVIGGEYREVASPWRLAFTSSDPDAPDDENQLVTVTFEPLRDHTRLTVDQRGVDGQPGDGRYHTGWSEALDSLAAHLGEARAAR
jgi:uncharacterized protein YndB with AHSA1/START domain